MCVSCMDLGYEHQVIQMAAGTANSVLFLSACPLISRDEKEGGGGGGGGG